MLSTLYNVLNIKEDIMTSKINKNMLIIDFKSDIKKDLKSTQHTSWTVFANEPIYMIGVAFALALAREHLFWINVTRFKTTQTVPGKIFWA